MTRKPNKLADAFNNKFCQFIDNFNEEILVVFAPKSIKINIL